MALPQLTPEQRQSALEKAAEARAARAAVKAQLKAGALSMSEFLRQSDTDVPSSKMKVLTLLESMPGVGNATARRILEEIGISESRRVRGLGPNQRSALIERFG